MISTQEPATNGTHVSQVITDIQPDQRARMLEKKTFALKHSLGNFPGLSLDNIRKLTRQLLEEKRYDQVYCRALDGSKNDTISPDAVLATLQNFESSGAWLRLTRVDEINHEFREICETFYAELSALMNRDIKSEVMKTFVTLFISAPGALTPYHIDHTWNFLLQVLGHKTVHLYDHTDPRILRQQDTEAWYWNRFSLVKNDAVPGIAYNLAPGDGVHHPVNAPHWVQNGSDISVSLSFGLCLHAANDDAKVHQMNFLLRKLGLNPLPPRQSEWRDNMKKGAVNMISDRNPNSFDEVVYSGQRRMERVLKMARIVR